MVDRTDDQQFSKGARVRRFTVLPSAKAIEVESGIADETRNTAYVMAMANRHKPWARRWLRERRFSFHG